MAEEQSVRERRKAFQAAQTQWPAIERDGLVRVARGEKADKVPKWMMRQAGRYLPEFRAVRAEHAFFEVCQDPVRATEVTVQPLTRFKEKLDAMIIFSDILVIPQAMGLECEMIPGKGPTFPTPLEKLDQLQLQVDVEEKLGYVADALWLTRTTDNSVPLLGFCGAPWTLMAYMIEGGGSKTWMKAKQWLYTRPEESKALLKAISVCCVDYLVMQLDAGASLVQVFDTNAGEVAPTLYEQMMVTDLKWIASEVKKQRPHALVSIFPRNGPLATFNDSDYDVVGVSWTVLPQDARKQCPDKVLQGNLDPAALFAGQAGVEAAVQEMAQGFGKDKWICNLGHGMLPEHTPEMAGHFLDAVCAL